MEIPIIDYPRFLVNMSHFTQIPSISSAVGNVMITGLPPQYCGKSWVACFIISSFIWGHFLKPKYLHLSWVFKSSILSSCIVCGTPFSSSPPSKNRKAWAMSPDFLFYLSIQTLGKKLFEQRILAFNNSLPCSAGIWLVQPPRIEITFSS